jgi:hypothetical protein
MGEGRPPYIVFFSFCVTHLLSISVLGAKTIARIFMHLTALR